MNWIIAGGFVGCIYLMLFAMLKAGSLADEQSQRFFDELKRKKRSKPKNAEVTYSSRISQ